MSIKATHFKLPPGEATEGGNASGIAASAEFVSGFRRSDFLRSCFHISIDGGKLFSPGLLSSIYSDLTANG